MTSLNDILAQIPSVDELVNSLQLGDVDIPRNVVVRQARYVLSEFRDALRSGKPSYDVRDVLADRLRKIVTPSIHSVINATGVVLHTNLGRAPLAAPDFVSGYQNLEYDLTTGKRGRRDDHVSGLIEALFGATGIVVNNNAAAVLLVLNEFGAGREAIISRGEMIEIGEGFRISEIMARAGVTLREIGTTNCTHIDDYRQAITSRTALIVRVHPSNFVIQGYTKSPTLRELSALGRETGILVYEDLGSGCIIDLSAFGVREPFVEESLADGVSLVSFSGDKLLGGPQAGILVGNADLIARLRKNPIFRALRVDKVLLQLLSHALRHALLEQWEEIPAIHMIRLSPGEIQARAECLLPMLGPLVPRIVAGESVVGGGSTPNQNLPTALIVFRPSHATAYEQRLRESSPAIVARIENGEIVVDLRTVFHWQEADLVKVLLSALSE